MAEHEFGTGGGQGGGDGAVRQPADADAVADACRGGVRARAGGHVGDLDAKDDGEHGAGRYGGYGGDGVESSGSDDWGRFEGWVSRK